MWLIHRIVYLRGAPQCNKASADHSHAHDPGSCCIGKILKLDGLSQWEWWLMFDVWWDHQSFLQSTLSIILRQHTTTTSHEWLSTTDEPLYQRFSQVPPFEQRLQEGGGGGGGIEFKQWSSTSHSTFSMCVFYLILILVGSNVFVSSDLLHLSSTIHEFYSS